MMPRRKAIAALVVGLLVSSLFPLLTWAEAPTPGTHLSASGNLSTPTPTPRPRNTQSWTNGTITITFSTPETYPQCIDEQTSDVIWTTGVPSNWSLVGYVSLQYVLDNGARQEFQRIDVNQTGDLNLTLTYPPVSQWPPQSNGTREVHVDLAIVVYDDQGLVATWVGSNGTLGPGQDWNVFCIAWSTATPTPTITPVSTPSPTPTEPPTSVELARFGAGSTGAPSSPPTLPWLLLPAALLLAGWLIRRRNLR